MIGSRARQITKVCGPQAPEVHEESKQTNVSEGEFVERGVLRELQEDEVCLFR
jgi:hypothetical protein